MRHPAPSLSERATTSRSEARAELAFRALFAAVIACVASIALYHFNSASVSSAKLSSSDMSAAAPLVREATGQHTATMFLMHGIGGSAKDLSWMPEALGNPSYVKFVMLNAPRRPVTIFGGQKVQSWWDTYAMGPGGKNSEDRQQDKDGMLASARTINDLVQKEIDAGIPADRIVLAGFSQGSVLSFLAGLTGGNKIGGVAVLSGFVPLQKDFAGLLKEHSISTPVFWGHGTSDSTLPYAWAQQSWQYIQEELKLTDVTFKTYKGMGHSTSPEELDDLKTFLARVVPEQ